MISVHAIRAKRFWIIEVVIHLSASWFLMCTSFAAVMDTAIGGSFISQTKDLAAEHNSSRNDPLRLQNPDHPGMILVTTSSTRNNYLS